MEKEVSFEDIHSLSTPVIDVRSPSEFSNGHIYGAYNIPLFTDAEREEIGTIYKQIGKEPSIERGLQIVGPKLFSYVEAAKKIAPEQEANIYCWRGGMRSESITWLLRTAGFNVSKIVGGYKACRHHIRASFSNPANIIILGGNTGCGKTKILHQIKKMGRQIIDLEGIANHKGSAFGHINEKKQPTNEQFENNVYHAWKQLDLNAPIIIENESVGIGRVWIPDPLFEQMKQAKVITIEVPRNVRIQNLVEDYTVADKNDLIHCCHKISKKLGGDNLNNAIKYITDDKLDHAADIILNYYDKYYQIGQKKRRTDSITKLKFHQDVNLEMINNTITQLAGK